MGTHRIRCLCKYLLDDLQIQQVVVTTADNHAKTGGENIDQWSCVAVESVQAKKHLSQGKRKLCRIAGDHLDGTQQFPSVIAIAWPTKGSQKLVSMRLQKDRPGAHDFSAFASQIAWGTDLLEPTMRRRQRQKSRERPLPDRSSCCVHIHDKPALSLPREQAS